MSLTRCFLGVLVLAIVTCTYVYGDWSDDFEDGVIDSGLWAWGGEQRDGATNWSISHTEIVATDGYLHMNVQGSAVGTTAGADAWLRTAYNYKDGNPHLINFTLWPTRVVRSVGDSPTKDMCRNLFNIKWLRRERAGRTRFAQPPDLEFLEDITPRIGGRKTRTCVPSPCRPMPVVG